MAANNFDLAFVMLFFFGGAAMSVGAVVINMLMAGSHKTPTKTRHYECGEVITPSAWVRYNARYYLFALLFVLFDVDAAFTIPWAVAFRKMCSLGQVLLASLDMIVFLFIIAAALVYAWRKGVAKWV